MMFACGQKDRLYPSYKHFEEMCREKGMDVSFFELPDLAHEWRFWDKALQEAIRFFGINEKGFIAF